MKFSIALIARNESKTLPRLIGSLSEFQKRGGEILLLDTGSKDNTAQIARDLGCIVHEVGDKFRVTLDKETADEINKKFVVGLEQSVVREGDSMFDYSSARNYIAQFASNDMLATPDCDEIYTKLDLDALNQEIENGADQLEYQFVYAHDEAGNEMIKFLHCKFYNRKKLEWSGIIHEVLVPINGSQPKRINLPESIIKLEHWQNPETNRGGYLVGLAYDCFKNPTNDRNAHYFARELFYHGRFNSAIQQFKKHIEMNAWPTERAASMCYIGESYMLLGKREEAFKYFWMSFDLEPNRREPLMKIAEYYYETKQADKLIPILNAVLSIPGGDFYANYQPYYENLPHEMMYWALWEKGAINASRDHFIACLGYQPLNEKYLKDFRWYFPLPKLSFVIPSLGRREGLERVMSSIVHLEYPQDKIEIIIVHDGEEPTSWEKDWNSDTRIKVVSLPERQGVPKALKKGVEESTGDWIVYAANDCEFTPMSLITAFKVAFDNNKKFMAFNTGYVGPDEGNICEHFMIRRDLIEKLGGEIFDTDFHHVGVDNLLWAKLSRLGQAMRCEKAVVIHHHWSQNPGRAGGEMDETAKVAYNSENVQKDRELLAKKLLELDNPVDPEK